MRFLLAILSSVALAACAHSTVPNDNRADAFTGAVSGVIVLPDSSADLSCTQVSVYATSTDEQGVTLRVGRSDVHQGQGHCSYEITDLPPNLNLTVHVEAPSGVKCGNGASLAFASQSDAPISLKDNEGRTRDYQPQCSATTSLR